MARLTQDKRFYILLGGLVLFLITLPVIHQIFPDLAPHTIKVVVTVLFTLMVGSAAAP